MSEKNKVLRTIKMNAAMEVPIALGTLEYIADIPPSETWANFLHDLDNDEYKKLRNLHMETLQQKESTAEFQDKLKTHMEEVMKLYQAVASGRKDIIKPYLHGRTFNFVVGMPRTGGTTIYQAMSDIHGWPWSELLLSMTHNFMPNGRYCVGHISSEFDMGWRLPWNFHSLLFELCQFIVYANNEAPDSENIFLKSTALGHAVKFLNFLFGGTANFYVTVRHPAAILLSNELDKEITREMHMNNLAVWANYYSSILRECRPMGSISVIPYGNAMTEFINDMNEKSGTGRRIEKTEFFEMEDFDKDFYESPSAVRMFDYVKASWELFDIEFPLPKECI
jgi:hypothetical protein